MSNRLPVIVQTIVYKITSGEYFFLLLKRTEDRGGFWNSVNGTLEIDESVLQCRQRELIEETNITNVVSWSQGIINCFGFTRNDRAFVVMVFSAEVSSDTEIEINNEHSEYRWVTADEAKKILSFDEDRKGINIVIESRK